jgi:hypothetical protein
MTLRHLLGVGCAIVTLSATSARANQADFAALAKSTPGLIGYWSFEGNYEDQSAMGNNVKANGDLSLIKFGPGVNGGQAVEMDNETADTQYLSVAAPVGGTFDTPNQTVLVWSKSTVTKDTGAYDNLIDRASLWYIDTVYTDVSGATKSELVARIYTPSTPEAGGSGQVLSSASAAGPPVYITPGAWSFVGWTYDGKVMTTYIDGKPVSKRDYAGGLGPTADTPPASDAPTGNYDIFWGAWRGEPGYSLTGSFDDTVIYNRALTADEVKALFDAMMKPAAPAP